jgi:hypothetical protein
VAGIDLGGLVLTVVCWKWGKKYGKAHVARLQSMLNRHLHQPHRIVCITDQPKDLPPGVVPAPMKGVLPTDYKCIRRLWLYSAEAAKLGERLFQIDLDVVITDTIDPIVNRPEPFVIWKSDSNTEHKYAYNATLMLTTPGARREVWDRYVANPKGVFKAADDQGWWGKVNSDQAIATFILQENPPAVWTQEDGIFAYRVFAGKHGERGATLPEGARIVSFHGPRDPSIPELQERSPWIRTHWR